ncbi:MAG: TolC family protein [Deltaproteobacteria bacterium]|nr:MAG: TolC family protein [Deltaproteobacteria bacterium]
MRLPAAILLLLAALAAAACQHVPPAPLMPARTAAAYQARALDSPDLHAFLTAASGHAPAEWPLPVWDLRTLALAALYFHPDLDVVRAHADVAAAAIATAGARPNPTLSIAPQLVANPESGVSPWLTTVNFDWPIETAGKRARRIEHADAGAAAAREAVVVEAWRVRRELATAVVALAAATRERDALDDEVALDERLLALVEGRQREGAAAANDVTPLRLALLQARSDRAAAAARVGDARAHVAAALGVPAAALDGIRLPQGLDADDAQALLGVATADARRRALLERADVRQALAEYVAAEATLRLELARQYPDLRLGPSYEFDQGLNKWGFVLALDLPIMNRNEGPIGEAVAARAEAAAKVVAAQAHVIAEIEAATARRDGERARSATMRALTAERDANVGRVATAVRAGAADRVAELGAEVESRRARRSAAEAESALAQALVDVEAAMEGPLPPAALDRKTIPPSGDVASAGAPGRNR